MDSTTREAWQGIAIASRDFCPYDATIERADSSSINAQAHQAIKGKLNKD
jgi:hypothetical protein